MLFFLDLYGNPNLVNQKNIFCVLVSIVQRKVFGVKHQTLILATSNQIYCLSITYDFVGHQKHEVLDNITVETDSQISTGIIVFLNLCMQKYLSIRSKANKTNISIVLS